MKILLPDFQYVQFVLSVPVNEVPKNSSISYQHSQFKTTGSTSSRRSKNTMSKVSQMKKIYAMARSETLTTENGGFTEHTDHNDSFKMPEDLNDDFEAEVKDLYLWTQNLSEKDELVN